MSSIVCRLREKKRQWLKLASDAAMFGIFGLLGVFARGMSLRCTRRVACLTGDFAHRVVGLRRELVYKNIGLTFPEKSFAEIRSIATKVYRNVAVTLFDVLRFPLIRNREDITALIDMNPEVYLRGTDNGRMGAVVVSAHYGNWELMPFSFALLVKPISLIVKHLTNDLVDQRLNQLRTLGGNRILYDHQAVREGLRLLADGGVLAILADQSDPSGTYFGEFLGRRATVFHGAAFFALKAKVPLFVAMCRSGIDSRYKVDIHEIETSDLTFCKEDIATLASRYTRLIEEYIHRWPEEWFWLHNRWKNGGEWQTDG